MNFNDMTRHLPSSNADDNEVFFSLLDSSDPFELELELISIVVIVVVAFSFDDLRLLDF